MEDPKCIDIEGMDAVVAFGIKKEEPEELHYQFIVNHKSHDLDSLNRIQATVFLAMMAKMKLRLMQIIEAEIIAEEEKRKHGLN